jgi:hypothetical protein
MRCVSTSRPRRYFPRYVRVPDRERLARAEATCALALSLARAARTESDRRELRQLAHWLHRSRMGCLCVLEKLLASTFVAHLPLSARSWDWEPTIISARSTWMDNHSLQCDSSHGVFPALGRTVWFVVSPATRRPPGA